MPTPPRHTTDDGLDWIGGHRRVTIGKGGRGLLQCEESRGSRTWTGRKGERKEPKVTLVDQSGQWAPSQRERLGKSRSREGPIKRWTRRTERAPPCCSTSGASSSRGGRNRAQASLSDPQSRGWASRTVAFSGPPVRSRSSGGGSVPGTRMRPLSVAEQEWWDRVPRRPSRVAPGPGPAPRRARVPSPPAAHSRVSLAPLPLAARVPGGPAAGQGRAAFNQSQAGNCPQGPGRRAPPPSPPPASWKLAVRPGPPLCPAFLLRGERTRELGAVGGSPRPAAPRGGTSASPHWRGRVLGSTRRTLFDSLGPPVTAGPRGSGCPGMRRGGGLCRLAVAPLHFEAGPEGGRGVRGRRAGSFPRRKGRRPRPLRAGLSGQRGAGSCGGPRSLRTRTQRPPAAVSPNGACSRRPARVRGSQGRPGAGRRAGRGRGGTRPRPRRRGERGARTRTPTAQERRRQVSRTRDHWRVPNCP
jgi:hypothetical protein